MLICWQHGVVCELPGSLPECIELLPKGGSHVGCIGATGYRLWVPGHPVTSVQLEPNGPKCLVVSRGGSEVTRFATGSNTGRSADAVGDAACLADTFTGRYCHLAGDYCW